jgi:hypothetical protein
MVAPKCVKSSTDNEDPIRGIPKRDKAAPKRAKDLKDKDAPTCSKSKIANDEPRHPKPTTDKDEPMRAKDLSDNDAPKWA